jgi:hypothetical protein
MRGGNDVKTGDGDEWPVRATRQAIVRARIGGTGTGKVEPHRSARHSPGRGLGVQPERRRGRQACRE